MKKSIYAETGDAKIAAQRHHRLRYSAKFQHILRPTNAKPFTSNRTPDQTVSSGENKMSAPLTKEEVRQWLRLMKFKLKNGSEELWEKVYAKNENYKICVDLQSEDIKKCKIDYGKKITLIRKTICTFSKREFLVVLECVNRLLDKGYEPKCIVLEKSWNLGRKEKGFLDISLVEPKTRKSYLMIECKQDSVEFDKEQLLMQNKGGQLFSYYIQEPETKYLCLYYSELIDRQLNYSNAIVKIKSEYKGKNQDEIHKLWDKLFENKGVFEKDIEPYNIKFTGIRKNDLQELRVNDGRFIFNRFAEILRKNVVSDKTNAYNKMFNLFLCKIVDEDTKSNSEEMDFQWREDEDNKLVMLRLNDLYKKGMKDYLQISIADYTQKEIDQLLTRSSADSLAKVRQIIVELRLYTNNEFAFKEVFDKKTFEKNCIVVKEVVQLLQKYKLKYTTKQQFLGDFFEKLLNTGIKQEAGQYFTPIPLARFICKSLPIKDIIDEKNQKEEQKILPYVVDYASGSGHFLTEIMSEIDKHVHDINPEEIRAGKRATDQFIAQKENYLWATEYIYGIEKDYRLAKTTKVSCFLNGDGDANIFCADGLDSFSKSSDYKGILKTEKHSQDNCVFDVVVANPPYSVTGFKNMMTRGEDSFDLYKHLTENSSEIECLFVERTKQLLREGGCAGIILPSSLLSNQGIYARTRNILIEHFEVKGIVLLGNNAFMATDNYTVVLFIKKRAEGHADQVMQLIETFQKNYSDVSFENTNRLFSAYVKFTYPDFDFGSYVDMLKGRYNDKVKSSRIYQDYVEVFNSQSNIKMLIKSKEYLKKSQADKEKMRANLFEEFIWEQERRKLYYFILTYKQKVVLVKSGDKVEEKKFLGYEFSNRRGHEGIRYRTTSKGHINTRMFNEENLYDETKINSIILRNYRGEDIGTISEELRKNVELVDFHELFEFDLPLFSNVIRKSKKKRYITQHPLKRVHQTLDKISSKIEKIAQSEYKSRGKIPIVSQESETISGYTSEKIQPIENSDLPLIVFGDHTKIFKYIDFPFVCGADGVKLLKPNKKYRPKAYYYIIRTLQFDTAGKYSRHFVDLAKMDIPVPPLELQDKIIEQMDKYESQINKLTSEIKELNQSIIQIIISESDRTDLLGKICEIILEKEDPQSNPDKIYSLVGLENMEQDTGRLLNVDAVPGKEILSVKNKFQEGHVLYGKLRPYLNKVHHTNFGGICSTDILVLQHTKELLDSRILCYILLDSKFVENTSLAISGLSLPRISPEDLLAMRIKYPSHTKQKNLIKIINKSEADIKEKMEKQEKLKQKQIETLNNLLH